MDHEIKKRTFVELRVEGLSLQTISNMINISKPTLIKWGKELQIEINNQKALSIEVMR